MIILAYGIKQPTQGDRGSVFFPALEELCQRMATHTHNDLNSAPISSASITLATVVADAGNWTGSNGSYSQEIDLPAGYTTAKCMYQVRISSSDEVVYPTIERISSTKIKIYSARNDLAYKVYFK